MKKNSKIALIFGIALIIGFALWTALISFVDVKAIGPNGSSVGFSCLNGFFQEAIGVDLTLYNLTDYLSLIPLASAAAFAFMGLFQWIKRRKISRVDFDILVLGGFYIVVFAAYLLFEIISVNFRPVLIDGILESSYPSSTTMLILCIMPTAAMQISNRLKIKALRIGSISLISAFTAFMLIGRIFSGVHWITDIIGGILISGGLVSLYYSFSSLRDHDNN